MKISFLRFYPPIRHPFCVRLSCEMSKIMHTPAYNRLNGKHELLLVPHDDIAPQYFMSNLFVGLLKILDVHLALTLIWSRQLLLVMTWAILALVMQGSISSMIFITSKRDVGFHNVQSVRVLDDTLCKKPFFTDADGGNLPQRRVWTANTSNEWSFNFLMSLIRW